MMLNGGGYRIVEGTGVFDVVMRRGSGTATTVLANLLIVMLGDVPSACWRRSRKATSGSGSE